VIDIYRLDEPTSSGLWLFGFVYPIFIQRDAAIRYCHLESLDNSDLIEYLIFVGYTVGKSSIFNEKVNLTM
jgi:hypothetical protein